MVDVTMPASSQDKARDPRKEGNAPPDLPPWKLFPRGKFTEMTVECTDSASSIAAYKKRDARGTLLVDVALSDAGGGTADEPSNEPASSSSRPPEAEDSSNEVSAAFGTLCISELYIHNNVICKQLTCLLL